MSRELAARGKRVAGVFVLMLGGGLALETDAVEIGMLLMTIGGLSIGWGLLGARHADTEEMHLASLSSEGGEPRR